MIEYEDLKKVNEPFFNEYREAFSERLQNGWYILGDSVNKFEKEFADYCGARYCIGVASGLDALVLSLKIFGFKPDSEVIVPSNTYIATILSIIHSGLKPVLVEPDINTYNIDPSKIEDAITSKTAAIMVVHLYGKMCNMYTIVDIANRRGLKIVEDCAQAHGSTFNGKKAGAFGHCNAFSFYPTKNLGALGDAGCVITEDEGIAEKVRSYRNYGSKNKYYNEVVGYNSRLDEIQAAFLSIKLKKLDEINNHKRKLATIYLKNIRGEFIKPVIQDGYYDTYHIFNIRHKERDRLKKYLLESGIKTEIHYPVPPHKQKALKGIFNERLYPITEEIHSTILSLPISYGNTEEEIYRIIEKINNFESRV